MIKTDVPGLETDGKNSVINRDLSPYYEMVARRKARQEQDSMREELRFLQREVSALREQVRQLHNRSVE